MTFPISVVSVIQLSLQNRHRPLRARTMLHLVLHLHYVFKMLTSWLTVIQLAVTISVRFVNAD